MFDPIAKNETRTNESEVAPGKKAQCGGAAPAGADACCALDAKVKATGGSGCGCATRAETGARQKGGCC
jgi:hypothetical protein